MTTLNPVCHNLLYNCTHMAIVGVRGLSQPSWLIGSLYKLLYITYLIILQFGDK